MKVMEAPVTYFQKTLVFQGTGVSDLHAYWYTKHIYELQ
jgi:hypothetical protein